MDLLGKMWAALKKKTETEGFPVITTSLLSLGAGAAFLGRPRSSENRSPTSYLKRAGANVLSFLKGKEHSIPTLPPQNKPRPVVMFDSLDFLMRKEFSFFNLDFLVTKRSFTDIFLFHTAHLYELVHVSSSSTDFNRSLLQKIDPYGCISYKVYCEDKRKFTSKHLNRPLDKVVVISTRKDEYHKDFDGNILKLEGWPGKAEGRLLDLVNFFYNLHFINVKDFRNTIRSYLGKEFCSTFDKVQENIFVQRNIFTWDTRRKYREKVDELNQKRIEDFQHAKKMMDTDLKSNCGGNEKSVLGYILNFVVKAYF